MSICKCGARLQRLNSEKGRIQECTGCGRQWPCVRSDDVKKVDQKPNKSKMT